MIGGGPDLPPIRGKVTYIGIVTISLCIDVIPLPLTGVLLREVAPGPPRDRVSMQREQTVGGGFMTSMPRMRRRRSIRRLLASRLWWIGLPSALAILATSFALAPAVPASAATAMTVAVTSSPTPVASGQAMGYRITAANTSGADASGLTLTDSVPNLKPPSASDPNAGPYFTTSTGSCSYDTSTSLVTCTAAALPAGQVWTVTITGQLSAAAGAVIPDSATVTGTESGSQFTASGNTSTTVGPGLPAGFSQTQLGHGLKDPVVMTFVPGGDIWVGEEGGTILDYHNGAIQPTPVATLPNVFFPQGSEDGLLGIALDPNFASNGYVYISYTVAVAQQGVTNGYARVSRFTYSGGTINPATEMVLYQGDEQQALHHPGNDLQIGPDGKLWWSVGDNDPNIWNGEALNNIYGKIIRFNLDGSIPGDDPFANVPSAAKGIYAYGLRNPFRFTFLPSGQAMTADTGSSYWEEMDTISPGGNYGWPWFEGNSFSAGTINPAYAYGHLPVDGAVSAIAAYAGPTFPKAYDNVVFFGDYNRADIEAVSFAPGSNYTAPVSDTVFDTNAGTISDLLEGPDGNLYFLDVFEGTLSEISAPGPFPPTAKATATPDAGAKPLTVSFSSAGSSDPFGKTLKYSWKFGDGGTSTAANPTHTYTASGTYTATLTVRNGTQTGKATTTVVVGQKPPTASITAPSTYSAGDTINFSGTASDPVDGTLPPYRYTWRVDLMKNGVAVPSWNTEVPGPFYGPVTGITSGSFQVPTDPSQVPGSSYRITLTVTDSHGLQTVVTKDITPITTSWTVKDPTAGTGYFVDGAWHTGTYTTQDVVGVQHVLTGQPLATVNGTTRYRFSGWADGSALTDSFTSTATAATYTAKYEAATTTLPAAWKSVDVGSPVTAGSTDYAAGSRSFYLDAGGTDEFPPTDQAHFAYQTMPGDGTIVARLRYQTNSDPGAKAGLEIRQSTTTGAPWVDVEATPDVSPSSPDINGTGCDANGCLSPLPPVIPSAGSGVKMQTYSGSESSAPPLAGFTDPNKWLKLVRAGSTFTSYESADGTNWTQIGSKTVSMTGPVDIGLFDNAHNHSFGTVLGTAAFDHVKITKVPVPGPLPSPWQDTDVGSPAIAGSAGYTAKTGTFTVNGEGSDIYGSSDQFNYAYQPLAGDGNGTIIARVTSQTDTSSNAKAGIIIKQSTTAGSNYFLIAVSPGGIVKVQYDFNGSTQATGIYNFPNVWMKLVSLNGTFTASLSGDGTNWKPILAKNLPITFPATIGMFVCSHNTSQLGTATFDHVSFTPGP